MSKRVSNKKGRQRVAPARSYRTRIRAQSRRRERMQRLMMAQARRSRVAEMLEEVKRRFGA